MEKGKDRKTERKTRRKTKRDGCRQAEKKQIGRQRDG